MISVGKPKIENRSDGCYLSAKYVDDDRHISTDIWFKTPKEWGDGLMSELADPFLLLAYLPAIKSGQDIRVAAPVSESLLFHLRTELLYLFTKIYCPESSTYIKIDAEAANSAIITTRSKGVACGCSLGIDSLSAIKRFSSDDTLNGYKLTHLTYFNIGAFGDNLVNAGMAYAKNYPMVSSFAKEKGLPLISLESNGNVIFEQDFEYEQTHTFRNASAVMALGKVIGRYYYASSYAIDNFRITSESVSYQDPYLLPLISTSYVEFISADADVPRTEKTRYIYTDELTKSYLYVCWKDIFSNENPEYGEYMESIPYLNCTRCDKCMRTAVTIDILGGVAAYSRIFDVPYYNSVKNGYIYKVITESDTNEMYRDIVSLMKKENYVIPKVVMVRLRFRELHLTWLWNLLRRTKNLLKRQ